MVRVTVAREIALRRNQPMPCFEQSLDTIEVIFERKLVRDTI